jgi:protein-tyrosine phosphatase
MIEPSALPIMVHCTQGKDRTGLIITLVLLVLDVPVKAIEYDYGLTDAALASEKEERLAEIREIGLTDEWGLTAKDLIVSMVRHLDENYDGVDGYLDKIGFTDSERQKLRELLSC